MEVDQVTEAATKAQQRQSNQNQAMCATELKFDSDRLKIFYERIFPYKMFFKWLSYNLLKTRDEHTLVSIDDKEVQSDYFYNREFSFTLANDVYCRYLCFKTAEEFKTNLVSRVPHKIDIGAVFNFAPSRHLTCSDKKAFVPVEKEMVFDIDMDAYDDVRSCCSGANVCQKCWLYLNVAAKLITDTLREDFDFDNCLWVFSGRRGVHCWICDPEARNMSNEMRTAVTQYCNIGASGNENSGKVALSYPLHPNLRRAYNFLVPFFENIVVEEQNLLSDEKHQARFIAYMP
jgi:DNA primase small subunit